MGLLIGNLSRGMVFVISAPAGTGKSTLVSMLKAEFSSVKVNVSFTTREPRPYEILGEHYQFVSKEEFERKIAQNEFLEYVFLYGNYYGTSHVWIEEQRNLGQHVILVIDTQGALLLKKIYDAVYIFIAPPSMEELKKRLILRSTETEEMIEERLLWVNNELAALPFYDYKIVNDDLNIAYQVLRSVLIAEEHRICRAF